MIDAVKGFLCERGLIRSYHAPYNVMIGRSLSFEFREGPRLYTVVKASRRATLRQEFEAQKLCHLLLPGCVPEPLAFRESQGWYLLASQGVPHEAMNLVTVRSGVERVRLGMVRYTEQTMHAFVIPCPTHGHLESLKIAMRSLDSEASLAFRVYYRRFDLDSICARLPYVAQHGDLVSNNLGLTREGIVIFDWEDFGKVEISGFDIALFLVSSLGYSPEMLRRWYEKGVPRGLDRIINAVSGPLGLSRDIIWNMAPLYLTFFLHLKKKFGYQPRIANLVRGLILALCTGAAEPGPPGKVS
jgi:hypothetical protein